MVYVSVNQNEHVLLYVNRSLEERCCHIVIVVLFIYILCIMYHVKRTYWKTWCNTGDRPNKKK